MDARDITARIEEDIYSGKYIYPDYEEMIRNTNNPFQTYQAVIGILGEDYNIQQYECGRTDLRSRNLDEAGKKFRKLSSILCFIHEIPQND